MNHTVETWICGILFVIFMSALYKSIFPEQKPFVSLLNIGSEEIKGTDIAAKPEDTATTESQSYNFFNDDSGIFHHDIDAFNSNNLYNK